jgi:hypothetical protein
MKGIFVVAAAFALSACSDITSPAPSSASRLVPGAVRPAVLVNEKTPWSAVFWNTCSNETVVVEGESHHVTKLTTSESGEMKFSDTNETHFKGYGATTLAKYEGEFKTEEKQESSARKFEYETSNKVTVKGQGKIPDFVLEFKTTIKIGEDGQMTIDDDDFKTSCK